MARKGEGFIFYHIMKTGGVWVRHALQNAGISTELCKSMPSKWVLNLDRQHAIPSSVLEEDKVGGVSFCFVRHPLTWYQSFWCFRWAKHAPPEHNWHRPGVWDDDFNTFVINVLDVSPRGGFLTWYYQQYVDEDLSGVDFIGRQESAASDLVRALNLAGLEFDERAVWGTGPYNYARGWQKKRARYTDEVKERVLERERWVIETFYNGPFSIDTSEE